MLLFVVGGVVVVSSVKVSSRIIVLIGILAFTVKTFLITGIEAGCGSIYL